MQGYRALRWVLVVLLLVIVGTLSRSGQPEKGPSATSSPSNQLLFEASAADHSVGVYHITGNGVLYRDTGVMEDADPETFRVLVYDEQNVHLSEDPTYPFAYASDRARVYALGDQIVGANPETFKILSPGTYYSADDKSVFVVMNESVHIIENADPNTFVVLREPGFNPCTSGYYAKDANHVFFGTSTIENADPNTFVVLGLGYARDDKHVYESAHIMLAEDPTTFDPPSCAKALQNY